MSRAVSIVPDLIDRLVQLFSAQVPVGVTVEDGWGITENSGVYLYVGADSPFAASQTTGATATQEWPMSTTAGRREQGTITCAVVAWDGSGDMKVARDAAFEVVAVAQRELRADTRLALDGLLKTSFTGLDYGQDQTEDGAVCLCTFSIDFAADLRGEP